MDDTFSTSVLLRHDCPDGSAHFDWLIDTGAARVPTFRLIHRPDADPPSPFHALRLPDHRRLYLTYRGPLSGDRGTVSPVARFPCAVRRLDHATADLTLRSGTRTLRLLGTSPEGSHWRFTPTNP